MKKPIATAALCGLMVLLSASCGRQHTAESLATDFMQTNMKDYSQVSDLDFTDLDSTTYITDSVITAMRRNVSTAAPQYRANISYAPGPAGSVVMHTRANYKIGSKEFCDTYYFDRNLTRVVGFSSMEK